MTVNATKAGELLREHFRTVGPDEFLTNDRESSPEDVPPRNPTTVLQGQPAVAARAGPMEAYLSTALTGLDGEQRESVFGVAEVIQSACRRHAITVYDPREHTDLSHVRNVRDADVFALNRRQVATADLFIMLCHVGSFGVGMALEIASNALVPILLIAEEDAPVSKMVTGTTAQKIYVRYRDPGELEESLDRELSKLRPLLEERRRVLAGSGERRLGIRILARRRALKLSRADVVSRAPLLTVALLRQWEESADQVANPSLIHLHQIAGALRWSIHDLLG